MERDGDDIVLDGLVGIGGVEQPDAVIVLAGQTLPSAFLVVRGTRGLGDAGRLMLESCRVPESARIGGEGEGMRIAVSVRELFGASAAAAAIGLARAILDRIADCLVDRATFGRRLPCYQEGQARLADLATRIDAADLVTYRAAWARDHQQARMPRESAMARLCAFDAARAALDSAELLLADQPEWLAAMQAQGREIALGHDRDVERLLLAGQTLNLLHPAVDGWRGRPRVGAASQG
jgi:acyl-CoA dehydrogenase